MKGDAETPSRPPKKRRALERADARHLAIWAADEALPAADRERVQAERDRRKAARPDRLVGVLVGPGGATPEQLDRLADALRSSHPTEVHHPFCQPRVHSVCRDSCDDVRIHHAQAVIRECGDVIGLVNETAMPIAKAGIWAGLRYAKDRGANVTIIWPDGRPQNGRW